MTDDYPAILRVNGQVVGSFRMTGVDAVDAERVKKSLADFGYEHSSPESSIFRQAESFEYAAKALFASNDWRATIPSIVNGCFSVELYFKSIFISQGTPKKGHSLATLFTCLPDSVKSEADRLYNVSDANQDYAHSFHELIDNLDRGFEEWRYLHEKKFTNIVSVESVLFACAVSRELASSQFTA